MEILYRSADCCLHVINVKAWKWTRWKIILVWQSHRQRTVGKRMRKCTEKRHRDYSYIGVILEFSERKSRHNECGCNNWNRDQGNKIETWNTLKARGSLKEYCCKSMPSEISKMKGLFYIYNNCEALRFKEPLHKFCVYLFRKR